MEDKEYLETDSQVSSTSGVVVRGYRGNVSPAYTTSQGYKENNLVFSIVSPHKTEIRVYDNCVSGCCNCLYLLDGSHLQLKPCRFASLICSSAHTSNEDRLALLWSVTDGFPIVQGEVPSYECVNYNSILAEGCKEQMDSIIRRELAEGIITETQSRPHCIHSLGAVPKPGGKIRPITDCSRPHSQSVNNFCGDLLREFKFKSVDDVVCNLNQGDFMSVIDIKAAYRAVPIDPAHRKYMGFKWFLDGQERTYVDNRLCFGLRLGPCYFDEISDFVYNVLREKYNMRLVNYLDDFAVISESYVGCLQEQSRVIEMLRFLGFHVSYEKVIP